MTRPVSSDPREPPVSTSPSFVGLSLPIQARLWAYNAYNEHIEVEADISLAVSLLSLVMHG